MVVSDKGHPFTALVFRLTLSGTLESRDLRRLRDSGSFGIIPGHRPVNPAALKHFVFPHYGQYLTVTI